MKVFCLDGYVAEPTREQAILDLALCSEIINWCSDN